MRAILLTLAAAALLGGCCSSGMPVHFELTAQNPEKLGEFYGEMFGWNTKTESGPQGYREVETPGISGGIYKPEHDQPRGVVVYMLVESVAGSVSLARSLGASVVVDRTPVADTGFYAILTDPEGNRFGVFEHNPEEAGKALAGETPTP